MRRVSQIVSNTCSWAHKRKGETQMKDEGILRDLSGEILVDMDNWNKSNSDATFLEIEEKARELVSKLEVALIEKSALEREAESWTEQEEKERPICQNCKVPLVSRGKHTRNLQGASGREIKLKRTYGTCPNCGTGLFPP
jgi:RNase P subunit RPR2